jgi:hypothetical protein
METNMTTNNDTINDWLMTQIRIRYANLNNLDRVEELDAIEAIFPTTAAQEPPDGQRLWLMRQLALELIESGALDRSYL